MNRALLTYLIFLAVLIGGLWAVLQYGSGLRPADHIEGSWQARGEGDAADRSILVRQSGQFLEITGLRAGPPIRLRLTGRTPDSGDWRTLTATGDNLQLQVRRTSDGAAEFILNQQSTGPLTRIATHAGIENGAPAGAGHAAAHPLLTLLVQVALILVASRLIGTLFARIGQPQVMGEMVAGIILGPSLFGLVAPELSASVFPPESIKYLNLLSQVGVVFFLFLIGLDLDPKLIRNRGHAAIVISHASIIAPFLLGAGLVLYLYPHLFNDTYSMRFTAVALFMGAAMSITAFPVLARILTERNLHKTRLGAIAITCAAVDDVTAWCMLAFVVGVARAQGLQPAILTAVASTVYVLVMFFLVRPFLHRLQVVYERRGHLSRNLLAVIILLMLVSAYVTERIGIHALFGAFLMGAIMPKGTGFVRSINERIEDFVVVFLLPIFFAYTGLKTQIGLLDNASLWLDTLFILGIACLGKLGGSAVAATACGLNWRESGAVGILMNTRGLMELVILNIGRELGVITDAVFAMMVIMALTTTALTTPLLNWVYPARLLRKDRVPREPAAPGTRSILIPVSLPKSGAPLVRLADLIAGPRHLNRRIGALFLRRPDESEAYYNLEEEIDPESLEPLKPLMEQARHRGIDVEPLTAVSRDVPRDIVRFADEQHADLILMGFHKPVIGNTLLGGTVYRVLSAAGKDVAIFVDRGLHELRSVLVPYMGGRNDRFAMEIGRSLATNGGVDVTVLHIIPPGHPPPQPDAGEAAKRTFHEPGAKGIVTVRLLAEGNPVDTVLRESPRFDLIVVGVEEGWGLESNLFAWRSERIARDCATSLLIVRKGESHPDGDAPAPHTVGVATPAGGD